MNTEDFVTYEQALALKKLGFDNPCTHNYLNGKLQEYSPRICNQFISFDFNYDEYLDFNGENWFSAIDCSAPTLAQAQKWLRKERIHIVINPRFYRSRKPLSGYDYHIFNEDDGMKSHIGSKTIYDSYEEALSAGITECIKLLEK